MTRRSSIEMVPVSDVHVISDEDEERATFEKQRLCLNCNNLTSFCFIYHMEKWPIHRRSSCFYF